MSYPKKPLPADSALAQHLEKSQPVVRFPTHGELNADLIAQIIDEHALVEGGRVVNVAYLAVKIAETLESLPR